MTLTILLRSFSMQSPRYPRNFFASCLFNVKREVIAIKCHLTSGEPSSGVRASNCRRYGPKLEACVRLNFSKASAARIRTRGSGLARQFQSSSKREGS